MALLTFEFLQLLSMHSFLILQLFPLLFDATILHCNRTRQSHQVTDSSYQSACFASRLRYLHHKANLLAQAFSDNLGYSGSNSG